MTQSFAALLATRGRVASALYIAAVGRVDYPYPQDTYEGGGAEYVEVPPWRPEVRVVLPVAGGLVITTPLSQKATFSPPLSNEHAVETSLASRKRIG